MCPDCVIFVTEVKNNDHCLKKMLLVSLNTFNYVNYLCYLCMLINKNKVKRIWIDYNEGTITPNP